MRTNKILTAVTGAAMLLAACDVKEPIHNTPHPEHGKITLTTDWSERTEGIIPPASYTVKVGDHASSATATTHAIDNLFGPGTHRVHIYHEADNIALSGTTATADYAAGTLGWFFSHAMDAAIEKDRVHEFTAVMRQQVRELTLVVEPEGETADKVEAIAATLSGVAGTLDIDDDTHGAPTDIALDFTKITDGVDAGKWTATVRLLGMAGSEQNLTGTISFAGGSPGNVALDSDLTTALTDFNTGKKEPLILGGQVVETPSGVDLGGMTINGWQEQDTINGETEY